MTTVKFLTEGKRVTGFDVSGHSGYAEAGADVVCAAIEATPDSHWYGVAFERTIPFLADSLR